MELKNFHKKIPSLLKRRGSYLVKLYLLERLIQNGTSLLKREDRRGETGCDVKAGKLAIAEKKHLSLMLIILLHSY